MSPGRVSDGWKANLRLPQGGLEVFEQAFARLGGAVVTDAADRAQQVPLEIYFAAHPDQTRLDTLLAVAAAASGVPLPEVRLEPLPALDWVAESHKALPPIHAGRFYVFGSHVGDPPPPGSLPIRIDANLAFGTGRHETTRGCLLALSDLARARRMRSPLDMGCGSGILAIAMAKLWRRSVLAVDNDGDSLRMTGLNARRNGVGGLVARLRSDGFRQFAGRGPYDLVVANILAQPLAAMACDLAGRLEPGGLAILSGLLNHQAGAVQARYRDQRLSLLRRYRLGDWTTLVLRR